MRKIRKSALFAVIITVFSSFTVRTSAVSASSAIVMEPSTGQVVFEKDADTRRPMASTTKIMTGLLAAESGELEQEISVSDEAVGVEGSSIYLKSGDRLTLEDLTYALMLESANDAAAAIACALAGSVESFADMMNAKAAQIGLNDTRFANPHGLSADEHYTTARDLAKLTAYAMENETFKKIVSTETHIIEFGAKSVCLRNHNKLLRLYDGAIGVKTGFTKSSGRCLVSAAERDGLTLIAVTLNAPDDWNDHTEMLDMGFSALERVTLINEGESAFIVPCIGTEKGDIVIKSREGMSLVMPKGEHDIKRRVILPRYLWAPQKKDSVVGRIEFYEDGILLGSVGLYCSEDCERVQYKPSLFEKIVG